MTAPSAWIVAPDPYDNLGWQDRMQGPSLPSLTLSDAYAEPQFLKVSDPMGSGRIIRQVPAPQFKCCWCSKETSRRIVVDVRLVDEGGCPGGIKRRAVVQGMAQCPKCGMEQDAKRAREKP